MQEDLYSLYSNITKIAKSNVSIIYTAIDNCTNQKVILKEFYFDRSNFSEEAGSVPFVDQMKRFKREIEIHSSLEHKNIGKFLGFIEKDANLYIILDYIDGFTLQDIIEQNLKIGFIEIVKIISQIASALQYIHDKGIVHRDLKPSNILIDKNFNPYIIDFGCAKKIYNDILTVTKMLIGTLMYMSPEQILGSKELDGRSDIFSLGTIFYQLLTSQLPYTSEDPRLSINNIFHKEHINVRELNYLVPEKLEKLINQTLKKDPDHRCNTAKIIKYHLDKILEEPEIYYAQGKFYEAQQKYDKALEMYQKSLSMSPYFEPIKAIADISYMQGKIKDSLNYYISALNHNSSDSSVYERIGDINYKLMKYDEAILNYQKSLILYHDNLNCEIKIAQVIFLSGKTQESIKYYHSITERYPYNIQVLYELGIIYYKTSQKQPAIEVLERASYIDPSNTDILFYLASIYQENNQVFKAVDIYERIENLKPDLLSNIHNLACAYYQIDNYAKSKEKIKKLIKNGFESFQGYVLLGLIYESQENSDKAIECYQRAIALEPENLTGYLYLSACFRNNWRLNEAIKTLNTGIKINTLESKSEIYFQYAELLREKGLYEEAKQMYKECIIITKPCNLREMAKKQLESLEPQKDNIDKKQRKVISYNKYVG